MTCKRQPLPVPANLMFQCKFPPTKTFHEAPFRWLVRHALGYRYHRDARLCPCCAMRGTYRAYGLYWKDIDKRRWLCKWCGYMDSVAGQEWCVLSKKQGSWVGRDAEPDGDTPQMQAAALGWSPFAG